MTTLTDTPPAAVHPASRAATADITVIRWNESDRRSYTREHLNALKPAIILGAIDHWPARRKWTPQFFKSRYGGLQVKIEGRPWALRELIDRILASTLQCPAPYLHNQPLSEWPAELSADITPMPECTRPNYLESRLFPSRVPQTYIELYIGGSGAAFPTLHYDNLHTHAFLMQLYGTKEYLVFAPDQEPFLYPKSGIEANKSSIPDIEHVDLSRFPLYARARGARFHLQPGETLFVPAGWWHTARILSPSITVSINGANRANWVRFRRDYCAATARRAPWKSAVISAYLAALGAMFALTRH